MTGLFWKDVYVLRKQSTYYIVFLVIYAALVLAGVMPIAILGGLVVLVGMMLPMSSFSYDDMARWDKYAASTPAGRQGLVSGKYFFAFMAILAGSVLALILQAALVLSGLAEGNFLEIAASTAACLCVALVLDAVILPILIKFGAEKSRMITIIVFVAVFGGCMVIAQLVESGGTPPQIPMWLLNALPVVLVIAAVGAYAVSYFISLGVIAKKEL